MCILAAKIANISYKSKYLAENYGMKNVQNLIISAKKGGKTAFSAEIVKSYEKKCAFRKYQVVKMPYLCGVKITNKL